MRRFFKLLLITVISISMIACRRKPQGEMEDTGPKEQKEEQPSKGDIVDQDTDDLLDEVSSTAKLPPKKSIITTKKIERQLLNDDSTVTLLRGEYQYPQIENVESFSSIDKVNQEIKENTEAQFTKAFTEGASYVKEFYGKEGSTSASLPFVTEQRFDVTNNQNYIVSFKITSYDDFGGAHPNILQSAYTYDVRTGERLPASHFIEGTDEGVKSLVSQSFYTIVLEQSDAFYPNAGDILTKGQFEFDFYIQDDSITFFINPYIIAPYAAGVQEVSILLR